MAGAETWKQGNLNKPQPPKNHTGNYGGTEAGLGLITCFWKTGATKGAGDEVNPKPTALRAATHGSPFCIEHKKEPADTTVCYNSSYHWLPHYRGSRSTNIGKQPYPYLESQWLVLLDRFQSIMGGYRCYLVVYSGLLFGAI